MSLCKECISGKIEEISGVNTYVAFPPASTNYDNTKAVLFLPDAFNIQLINNMLLVDDFAKNGYATYAPDYFNGDPIQVEQMNATASALSYALPKQYHEYSPYQFNWNAWFAKHGPAQTRPTLDKVIAALGAIGYCFGARYVFDLAFDGVIKVAAVAHPSRLQVPEDLEKFKVTDLPLLINSCEIDHAYPPEAQKVGDDILGGGKMEAENYKRAYFAGCTHGFAVRGDLSISAIKAGKEQAFANTVEWFHKYF